MSRLLALLLGSVLVHAVAAPRPACADWPASGILVGTPYYTIPDMALLGAPDGGAIVLSYHSGQNIWWQAERLSGRGAVADSSPANLPFYTSGTGDSPGPLGVAVDERGQLWHAISVLPPASHTRTDLYLERIGLDGAHAPADSAGLWRVANDGADEWYPAVLSDSAGGVFLSWQRSGLSLYATHVDSSGTLDPLWPAGGQQVGAAHTYPLPGQRAEMLRDGHGGIVLFDLVDQPTAYRLNADGSTPPGWEQGLVLGDHTLPAAFIQSPDFRLFPSGPDHWVAVWVERAQPARILLSRFGLDGAIDGAWAGGLLQALVTTDPLGLFNAIADGAGGFYLGWIEAGIPVVRHVLGDGTYAPGFEGGGIVPLDAHAQPLDPDGSRVVMAPGPDGGLIYVWDDARPSSPGVRALWLRADGTLDPTEPDSGRVVAPSRARGGAPDSTARARDALSDGYGGVLVAWALERPPGLFSEPHLTRVFSNAVLAVPRAPAPARVALLLNAAPNPVARALILRFTLPDPRPARLELLDVSGRRVRSLAVAGAGAQTARFDDLGALPAGIYLARLSQGREQRTVRIAIVR